jgi:hypothetical protein
VAEPEQTYRRVQRIEDVAMAVRWVLRVGIGDGEVRALPALERVRRVDVEVQPGEAAGAVELDVLVGQRGSARSPMDAVGENVATERSLGETVRPIRPDRWVANCGASL